MFAIGGAVMFADLVAYTHADVDSRGEAHISCPECGAESSPKHSKCSFSERGFYCFVCGAKFGLSQLATMLKMPPNCHQEGPGRMQMGYKAKSSTEPVYAWASSPEWILSKFKCH